MKNLVKDASMGPLREALKQGIEITKLKKEDMRPVTLQVNVDREDSAVFKVKKKLQHNNMKLICLLLQDFEHALQEVRPSVSLNELGTYEEWNKQFGSLSL